MRAKELRADKASVRAMKTRAFCATRYAGPHERAEHGNI